MNKCPKCGYIELYWRPLRFDPEEEYCQLENFPEAKEWPIGKIIEKDGFVFWRKEARNGNSWIVSRLPVEVYRARGYRKRGRGTYYEGSRSRMLAEIKAGNQKLIHQRCLNKKDKDPSPKLTVKNLRDPGYE